MDQIDTDQTTAQSTATVVKALLLVAIAFAASIMALLVPLPPGQEWGDFYFTLMQAVFIAVIHFGIPYFLLSGINKFSHELRRAYFLICIAIVLLGIAHGQPSLLSALSAWNSIWVLYGFISLPYLFAAILLYTGVRSLARLVGVNNFSSSFRYAVPFTVALAASVTFLPHVAADTSETAFKASIALAMCVAGFFIFSAIAVRYIRRTMSEYYTRAMTWLMAAFIAQPIAGTHYVLTLLIVPTDHWYRDHGMALTVFAIAALFLLQASVAFNQIGQRRTRWIHDLVTHTRTSSVAIKQNATPIDVIVAVSELASRPDEIDIIMDGLRGVTSNMQSYDAAISDEDQKRLADVYKQLEQYLLEKERVRIFTRDSIREKAFATNELSPEKFDTFLKNV